MRFYLLLSAIILSIITTSCSSDKEPDLDFVQIIFCTPADPDDCLPLEITNTTDGWKAKYIGVNSQDLITLKPHYSIDEKGDSTITFDEYIGEKYNGSYSFSKISQDELFDPYDHVSYNNAQGENTSNFYAIIIRKGDLFIDNKDVAKDFTKIITHNDSDPVGCGSQRRDQNLTYLLHSNPQTLTYNFKSEEGFEVFTSEDGMLRIYKYNSWTGGNGFGADYNNLTVQYKTKAGVVTLDQFDNILWSCLKDFDDANFPDCYRLCIYQATLNGQKHYLIEAVFFDPVPMFFDEKDQDSMKAEDLVLFAYTIENGKLIPSYILEGKSMIELVSVECGDNIGFKYDDNTKQLQIPLLDTKTHEFTGKYRQIKIK